jgi:ABC-type phosphonate transport system ATPase subunit
MTSAEVAPAIRAVGLVKAFGEIRAVDEVSFELAPGRIYGLLGPSRSGQDGAHPTAHRPRARPTEDAPRSSV